MKIKYLKPEELIIPLCLVAFISPGIAFINTIFNTRTRWAILAVVLCFLIFFRWRDFLRILNHPLFFLVLIYAFWGFLTVLWSEVPQLSLYKSLVFIWISTTIIVAGYSWVMSHESVNVFDFLWICSIVCLYAAVMGTNNENLYIEQNYSGLTYNSNYLGFILIIPSCWLIWRIYLVYSQRHRFPILYTGLLTATIYYLYMSHSRSSMLIFISMVLGFLLGLKKISKWMVYVIIFFMVSMIFYNFSSKMRNFLKQYIFKTEDTVMQLDRKMLVRSREEIWDESYMRAMLGGAFGAGLGVSIGYDFNGEIGWSISNGEYGREHGNSQFAIMEQTGKVGISLYIMLIIGILWLFAFGLRVARNNIDRVGIGLLGGTIIGLLVQSVFEAWWVAPGAPESATFWMMLGAFLGVVRRAHSAVL